MNTHYTHIMVLYIAGYEGYLNINVLSHRVAYDQANQGPWYDVYD